jgi:hypothetical protein
MKALSCDILPGTSGLDLYLGLDRFAEVWSTSMQGCFGRGGLSNNSRTDEGSPREAILFFTIPGGSERLSTCQALIGISFLVFTKSAAIS